MFLAGPSIALATPGPRASDPSGPEATILKLRVGTYPTYTRVVLDTAAPLEWFVIEGAPDGPSLIVPGGVLATAIRPNEGLQGVLRAVRLAQRPGGAELTLIPRPGGVTVRVFALRSPDRIVVDVRRSGSAARRQTSSVGMPGASPDTGESASTNGHGARPTGSGGRTKPSDGAARGPVQGSARPITVVLDPGHGGHDTGAIGPSGLTEKEVVLDLALRLRLLLQERLGLRVLLTRADDVFIPLPERSALANRAKADFFISLHLNGSAQRDAVGYETFYYTREPSDTDARASVQRENLVLEQDGSTGRTQGTLLRSTLADLAVARDMKQSSDLAELELAALGRVTPRENRGVKSGPFHVLATVAMPAVLVESAFITNPAEEQRLRQDAYRQRLAEALGDGIRAFLERYIRRVGVAGVSAAPGS
jgi:N-acetylmuramoyl-L-alanine amidase